MIREDSCEIYVRAILYFIIASARCLNYYPDSIRTPIVAYINSCANQNINKCVKIILNEIHHRVADKIESNRERIGVSKSVIFFPLPLTHVIKECKSRDDFVDIALRLRDSPDVIKYSGDGFLNILRH